MGQKFTFPDEADHNEDALNVQDASPENLGEQEIDVEIIDDTPEKDKGRRPLDREVSDPTDEEIDTYTQGAQKRIKELTHARHDERRAKEAALREKGELEKITNFYLEENKKLKSVLASGTEQYGAMVKTTAQTELENARREFKAAQESFDAEAVLKAQETLFAAMIKVQQAENFRAPSLQEEKNVVQPRQQEPEPVRADEKTLRWQARNQWFGADGFEEITSFALGLHKKLVNDGIAPSSDEYFSRIDARVKEKFPEVFGVSTEQNQRQSESGKRPPTVVAPASRATGKRVVQLTPTQLALIKRYNLDPKVYAAEMLRLEKQDG